MMPTWSRTRAWCATRPCQRTGALSRSKTGVRVNGDGAGKDHERHGRLPVPAFGVGPCNGFAPPLVDERGRVVRGEVEVGDKLGKAVLQGMRRSHLGE